MAFFTGLPSDGLPSGRVGGLNMPILHFSFFKNDANQQETVKLGNMLKLWCHTHPMRGVLSMLALSIDHIDPL